MVLAKVQVMLEASGDPLESTVGAVFIVSISGDIGQDPLPGEVLIVVKLVDLLLECIFDVARGL